MKIYIIRNGEKYDLMLRKPADEWEVIKQYNIDEEYFTPAMINLAQIVMSMNELKYPKHL